MPKKRWGDPQVTRTWLPQILSPSAGSTAAVPRGSGQRDLAVAVSLHRTQAELNRSFPRTLVLRLGRSASLEQSSARPLLPQAFAPAGGASCDLRGFTRTPSKPGSGMRLTSKR